MVPHSSGLGCLLILFFFFSKRPSFPPFFFPFPFSWVRLFPQGMFFFCLTASPFLQISRLGKRTSFFPLLPLSPFGLPVLLRHPGAPSTKVAVFDAPAFWTPLHQSFYLVSCSSFFFLSIVPHGLPPTPFVGQVTM